MKVQHGPEPREVPRGRGEPCAMSSGGLFPGHRGAQHRHRYPQGGKPIGRDDIASPSRRSGRASSGPSHSSSHPPRASSRRSMSTRSIGSEVEAPPRDGLESGREVGRIRACRVHAGSQTINHEWITTRLERSHDKILILGGVFLDNAGVRRQIDTGLSTRGI
jgi:hypothetical protein